MVPHWWCGTLVAIPYCTECDPAVLALLPMQFPVLGHLESQVVSTAAVGV